MSNLQLFGRCLIVAFRMFLRLPSPIITDFRERWWERAQKQSREIERSREKSRRKIDRNFFEKIFSRENWCEKWRKTFLEKDPVKNGENYMVDTLSDGYNSQMSGSEFNITLIFARFTDFHPSRSYSNPFTNHAGSVVVTSCLTQFRSKYVLVHAWVDFMCSLPSAVSIIVTLSITSFQLTKETR